MEKFSPITIADYPYSLRNRSSFRYGGIKSYFDKQYLHFKDRYFNIVQSIQKNERFLCEISLDQQNDLDPFWNNRYIPPIDGMMLYTMISEYNPPIYMEVGSGNSTKFIAKAKRDHDLRTRIISIDPHPRTEIDKLCTEVIRTPLEDCNLDIFKNLSPDDILIIDSSHRCFCNSDVSVFFFEILPSLPCGMIYAIHDICLPDEIYAERCYNEQHILASYLLGGAAGDTIWFPTSYLSQFTNLLTSKQLHLKSGAHVSYAHGGGFLWMKRSCQ